jgi:hypothetical protein
MEKQNARQMKLNGTNVFLLLVIAFLLILQFGNCRVANKLTDKLRQLDQQVVILNRKKSLLLVENDSLKRKLKRNREKVLTKIKYVTKTKVDTLVIHRFDTIVRIDTFRLLVLPQTFQYNEKWLKMDLTIDSVITLNSLEIPDTLQVYVTDKSVVFANRNPYVRITQLPPVVNYEKKKPKYWLFFATFTAGSLTTLILTK